MGIKRDHIDRNSTPDAPQNWERYARLLREHGEAHPGFDFEERLEAEWESRLAARRKVRNRQRIAAPLVTIAVAAASFFLVSDTVIRNGHQVSIAEDPVLPLAPDAEPRRFAAPEIPPIWIDTTLPLVETPILPGIGDPSVLGNWADSLLLREGPVTGE